MEAPLTSYFFEKQLPKILLGAILPDVRSPHINPLTKQFANNGEQWDKQGGYNYIEEHDRLTDKRKDFGGGDPGEGGDPGGDWDD